MTPGSFFTKTLPPLLDAHGELAAAGYAALAAIPLTVEVAGSAWTLSGEDGIISVRKGRANGALTVTLTEAQFTDWVQNQLTFNGFLTARALSFSGGSLRDVSVWDSLWIALLEGWPVVDPGFAFLDRRGQPLDLARSFSLTDDPEDMAHFLREAGYIHLRGWIDRADIGAISRDMDLALPYYIEGDDKSWWADLSDGSRVCVRLQEFVELSQTTAKILSSEMWERMIQILEGAADRMARKPVEGRIIEALFKPVGVVSGASDLSFHRDCHLGRHSYACARMTVGIVITPSNEGSGLLRVAAGSHRLAMPVEVAKAAPYLPVIALPTEPGDLTVHLSCTLHEATAPVSAERRVMYTEIPLQPFGDRLIDTSVGYLREQVNDILRETRNTAQ